MADRSPQTIAIFDLDRTITTFGTYSPFLIFAAWRLAPWRLTFMPLALIFMISYGLKLVSRGRLKIFLLALMIGRADKARLRRVADDFVSQVIEQHLRPGALAAINEHKRGNHRLILATASFDFYADVFRAQLGIDSLVATVSVWGDDDRLSMEIDGENCYGPEKLLRLQEHLHDAMPLTNRTRGTSSPLIFYSDDKSDMPCSSWVDEMGGKACFINPKPSFADVARRAGFDILDWEQ